MNTVSYLQKPGCETFLPILLYVPSVQNRGHYLHNLCLDISQYLITVNPRIQAIAYIFQARLQFLIFEVLLLFEVNCL